jgi:hypothetical protein
LVELFKKQIVAGLYSHPVSFEPQQLCSQLLLPILSQIRCVSVRIDNKLDFYGERLKETKTAILHILHTLSLNRYLKITMVVDNRIDVCLMTLLEVSSLAKKRIVLVLHCIKMGLGGGKIFLKRQLMTLMRNNDYKELSIEENKRGDTELRLDRARVSVLTIDY